MLNFPIGTFVILFYLHFKVLFYFLMSSSSYIRSVFAVFRLCCRTPA